MKNNLLIVVSIAIALIGCGPNNGPIVPSNQGNDSLPMDSIVMPFEIWLDTTYANVVATNPATITLVGTYKYNGFSHFYDDLLTITFVSGNHFEGRTISNVFSGEYVISGNDVLITHVRCSQFGEKASEANMLHSFVVCGFTATETADGITFSKDGNQLEFINTENEEQYPTEYSYYSNNYWGENEDEFMLLTATILPGYIGLSTTSHQVLMTILDTGVSNYFNNYGIVVDDQKRYSSGHVQYSTWFVIPVLAVNTIEETFSLIRNFPTDNAIASSAACFIHQDRQGIYDTFTNEIVIVCYNGTDSEELVEFLATNGISKSRYQIRQHGTLPDGKNCMYITFDNIDTGIEISTISSIISNWGNIESSEMNLYGNDYLW